MNKLELSWELKVLIDTAFNFGQLISVGSCPNYGDFDYYEELVKIANEFLNTPPPEFNISDADTFYVNLIDRFSVKKLEEKFGVAEV